MTIGIRKSRCNRTQRGNGKRGRLERILRVESLDRRVLMVADAGDQPLGPLPPDASTVAESTVDNLAIETSSLSPETEVSSEETLAQLLEAAQTIDTNSVIADPLDSPQDDISAPNADTTGAETTLAIALGDAIDSNQTSEIIAGVFESESVPSSPATQSAEVLSVEEFGFAEVFDLASDASTSVTAASIPEEATVWLDSALDQSGSPTIAGLEFDADQYHPENLSGSDVSPFHANDSEDSSDYESFAFASSASTEDALDEPGEEQATSTSAASVVSPFAAYTYDYGSFYGYNYQSYDDNNAYAYGYDYSYDYGYDYGYDYQYDPWHDGYNYDPWNYYYDYDYGFDEPDDEDADEAIEILAERQIIFDFVGVPQATLSTGFIPAIDATLSIDTITQFAASSLGTFTGSLDAGWTYTESFDALAAIDSADNSDANSGEPTIADSYDASLAFTFTASGSDAGESTYSVSIIGSSLLETDPDDFDNRSLNYVLTVTTDATGEVTDFDVSGSATRNYRHATIDQPIFEDDPIESASDETVNNEDDNDLANTFSVIAYGSATVTFNNEGPHLQSSDTTEIDYQTSNNSDFNLASLASEDDDLSALLSEGADYVWAGQTTSSGSFQSTTTIDATYDTNRVLQSLTVADSWDDTATFGYSGTGIYTFGDRSGSVTEDGEDSFHDTGTVTLLRLSEDEWDVTGHRDFRTWGHANAFDQWTSSYASSSDRFSVSGTQSGSSDFSSSYDVSQAMELTAVSPDDDTESSVSDDSGSSLNDEPTYFWIGSTGNFRAESMLIVDESYAGSGHVLLADAYHFAEDGSIETTLVPVTGSFTQNGKMKLTDWTNFLGTYDSEGEPHFDIAEVGSRDEGDDLLALSASGSVNADDTGGLSGTISLSNNLDYDYFYEHKHDLSGTEPNTTASAWEDVLYQSTFDQSATGTKTADELSGSAWITIDESEKIDSYTESVWDDTMVPVLEDAAPEGTDSEDDEQPVGWTIHTIDLVDESSIENDFGYDISGTTTIDQLTGTQTEYFRYEPKLDSTTELNQSPDSDPTYQIDYDDDSKTTVKTSLDHSATFTDPLQTLSPEGDSIEVTLSRHLIEQYESTIETGVSGYADESTDPVLDGYYRNDEYHKIDSGRDGSSPYTRANGDTTFVGNASILDTEVVTTDTWIDLSLDQQGQWVLDATMDPNDPEAQPSQSTQHVERTFREQYDSSSGTISPDDDVAISWTGTATENGLTDLYAETDLLMVPTLVVLEADSAETADPSLDNISPPGLEWTASGDRLETTNLRQAATRDAVGVYTDGDLTGNATHVVSTDNTFDRTENAVLTEEGSWRTVSGSGTQTGVLDDDFQLDATGATTIDSLSGTITLLIQSKDFDDINRTDTFVAGTDANSDHWDSVGARILESSDESEHSLIVEGAIDTMVHYMPLTAVKRIEVSNSSSREENTTSELRETALLDDASDAPETPFYWATVSGNRDSNRSSEKKVTQLGNGAHTEAYGPADVTFSLTLDETDHSTEGETLSYAYDSVSESWIGGGFEQSTLLTDHSRKADGIGTYTFVDPLWPDWAVSDPNANIPDTSGSATVTHLIEETQLIQMSDADPIETPPSNLTDVPDFSGLLTRTDTSTFDIDHTGNGVYSLDAGATTLAPGLLHFTNGDERSYSRTETMARDVGNTHWTFQSDSTNSSRNYDRFESSIGGDWSGGYGVNWAGAFTDHIINDDENRYVSTNSIATDGTTEWENTSYQRTDHKRTREWDASGGYETENYDIPITGTASRTYRDEDADFREQTTITSSNAPTVRTGLGYEIRIDNATYGAIGSGSVDVNETISTPSVGGGQTRMTFKDHDASHTVDRTVNVMSRKDYGIVDGLYTHISTQTDRLNENDTFSDITLITRTDNSQWHSSDSGSSESAQDSDVHHHSTLDRYEKLETSVFEHHLDPSLSTSSRSGSRTVGDSSSYSGSWNSSSLSSPTNGWSSTSTSYTGQNTSSSSATGTITYGLTPDDDTGKITHSGTTDWSDYGTEQYGDEETMVMYDYDDQDSYAVEIGPDGEFDSEFDYTDDGMAVVPTFVTVLDTVLPVMHAVHPSATPIGMPLSPAIVDQTLQESSYDYDMYWMGYDSEPWIDDDGEADDVANLTLTSVNEKTNEASSTLSDAIRVVNREAASADAVLGTHTAAYNPLGPQSIVIDNVLRDALASGIATGTSASGSSSTSGSSTTSGSESSSSSDESQSSAGVLTDEQWQAWVDACFAAGNVDCGFVPTGDDDSGNTTSNGDTNGNDDTAGNTDDSDDGYTYYDYYGYYGYDYEESDEADEDPIVEPEEPIVCGCSAYPSSNPTLDALGYTSPTGTPGGSRAALASRTALTSSPVGQAISSAASSIQMGIGAFGNSIDAFEKNSSPAANLAREPNFLPQIFVMNKPFEVLPQDASTPQELKYSVQQHLAQQNYGSIRVFGIDAATDENGEYIDGLKGMSGFVVGVKGRPRFSVSHKCANFSPIRIRIKMFYVVFEDIGQHNLYVGDESSLGTILGPASTKDHELWHLLGLPKEVIEMVKEKYGVDLKNKVKGVVHGLNFVANEIRDELKDRVQNSSTAQPNKQNDGNCVDTFSLIYNSFFDEDYNNAADFIFQHGAFHAGKDNESPRIFEPMIPNIELLKDLPVYKFKNR